MQARYRKPPMFETFVNHLREISSPDLTWEVRHDSLVCFEKHPQHENTQTGKYDSVEKIIHALHMKLMPNECHKEVLGGVTHYKFEKHALIDQLNTRQWVVGRIKEMAEKIKELPTHSSGPKRK